MGNYDLGLVLPFILDKLDDILELTIEHTTVVLLSVFIASVLGVAAGLLVDSNFRIGLGANSNCTIALLSTANR